MCKEYLVMRAFIIQFQDLMHSMVQYTKTQDFLKCFYFLEYKLCDYQMVCQGFNLTSHQRTTAQDQDDTELPVRDSPAMKALLGSAPLFAAFHQNWLIPLL